MVASLLAPSSGYAQQKRAVTGEVRVDNVASATWRLNGTQRSGQSNLVSLLFVPPTALTVMKPDGAIPTPKLLAQSCTTANATVDANQLSSEMNALPVLPTTSVYAGQPLVLSLSLPGYNKDSAQIETVFTTIKTSTGDVEDVRFVETGANTGQFRAAVRTTPMPPAAIGRNCVFSVIPNSALEVDIRREDNSEPIAEGIVDVLIDPFGIVFDSIDGRAVQNVVVSLVDADTGALAKVFGDDGFSTYPSVVRTGETVVDSGGTVYQFPAGEYRFPLTFPGRYRLKVQPVGTYRYPSVASAEELALLRRPDNLPFTINGASFGEAFTLDEPEPVRVDIPLDTSVEAMFVSKTSDRDVAVPGEMIRYTVSILNPDIHTVGRVIIIDHIPEAMRYRPGSSTFEGKPIADPKMNADRSLVFDIGGLLPETDGHLTYALEVRPDAKDGDTINRVEAIGNIGGVSNISDSVVRISRDLLSERMTVTGQVLAGACGKGKTIGVPGVRIMMEDGSYAVSDFDGRYHLDGVKSGTHVVQVDRATLPEGAKLVDCSDNVRSGGRGNSRWIQGQGGSLHRADFRIVGLTDAVLARIVAAQAPGNGDQPPSLHDAAATGEKPLASVNDKGADLNSDNSDPARLGASAERMSAKAVELADELAAMKAAKGDEGFIYPTGATNPSSPVTKAIVRHGAGETAVLFVDDEPISPVAREGSRKIGANMFTTWRGIPLEDRETVLRVEIRDKDGKRLRDYSQKVVYSDVASRVELLRDKSKLVADGIQRPVLALRFLDRSGRPVHRGATGGFELPEPYRAWFEADAAQRRQLAGLGSFSPIWKVQGDDGVAYVELEPTTASGSLSMNFRFIDDKTTREQRLEAWLSPGDRPWTIVGLAEGTIGFDRLDKRLETLGADTPKDLKDGRLALYAKGRVLGKWLMTLSYDSDKDEDQTRFGGVIDPRRYYTVYADGSERRYDAASVRKLYLRLERPQFYALFGDYVTAIDEPILTNYVRAMNGGKAEYRSDRVAVKAFAADTPMTHQHDEIQGNGLSGPYRLGKRNITANSERIMIEVRDRFRSDRVISQQVFKRYTDYELDYRTGTIVFKEPILSKTMGFDPVFIVADYEVDGIAERRLNAGARATVVAGEAGVRGVQVGATAVHDDNGTRQADMVGGDVRAWLSPATEIRAEAAMTRTDGAGDDAKAWQVELRHQGEKIDAIAYALQRDVGFGVGQSSIAENGVRKVGIDGRYRPSDPLSITLSAWHQDQLATDAKRDAARLFAEYRRSRYTAQTGLTYARDQLADGTTATSTLFNAGANARMLSNRLVLGVDASVPLQTPESVDFPARYRATARYELKDWAALIGTYEITQGKVDAQVARAGIEVQPWTGARIALTGNRQDIAEYGPRSYAALGLSQSLILSKTLTVSATLDGNRTMSGIDPMTVIEENQPVTAGGYLGSGGLTEDFIAASVGAVYRRDVWSATARAEYRNGMISDQWGLTLGAIRQLGEGRAIGGGIQRFETRQDASGGRVSVTSGQLTWAYRPHASNLTFLDKLELRSDQVRGIVGGAGLGIGGALVGVDGNVGSTRLTNSLSINWSDPDNRIEIAPFLGLRYVSDRLGGDDFTGFSGLVGTDARFSIANWLEVGGSGSLRIGLKSITRQWSLGPQVGLRPFDNGWLMLGYNVVGYRDRDFQDDHYTRSGPYASLRFKFDELSLQDVARGIAR